MLNGPVEPEKKAKVYQLTWIISVAVTITLSLTLPFANFVILNFLNEEKIAVEVGILKCFSEICSQDPIAGLTDNWQGFDLGSSTQSYRKPLEFFHLPDWKQFIPDSVTKNLLDAATPGFVRWAKVGSVGTIVFIMLAGLAALFQIVSLLIGGREVESYMQEVSTMCRNGPSTMITSRVLVLGSTLLVLGEVWYPLASFSVLNGGTFIYGFWISFLSAFSSLILAIVALRDKTAWAYLKGFTYEPIPSRVGRVELEGGGFGDAYDFPGYRTP